MNIARSVIFTSAALVLAIGLGAQAKPDFSGTWVIVTPQAGAPSTLVIKQDATSVSETDGATEDAHTITVKLDGTQSRMAMPVHTNEEVVVLSTAAWRGNSLVLSSTVSFPNGNKRDMVRVWTLDAENQLQVEATRAPNTPEARTIKAVYTKK